MTSILRKIIIAAFIASIAVMLWMYVGGYSNAINWEVTTTGEVITFPAWELTTDLMTHQIIGEQYLLQENYAGGPLTRNLTYDYIFMGVIWLALCLALTGATYLKRYAFFAVVALFAIFLNRLNLHEIGLFGLNQKIVLFIPFLLLVTPLVIFQEYKKGTPPLLRFATLLIVSGALLLGISEAELFVDHLIAHSLFGYTICGLIFLFLVTEEIVFAILFVITSSKGGKSNHLHFIILSTIYLGNTILYYLNKSGIYKNSFFFFDPFILLVVTSLVAIWSFRFKTKLVENHMSNSTLYVLFASLGILTFSFLGHQFFRGNDGVFESFHYFIVYFHIGFGVLFFLYILSNFIDPLIKGFEIYKIAYQERNFPYATARLGGLVAIAAFYFVAAQEPYNLLKSGYYNYLASQAEAEGNNLLAKEYILQSSYLGYNTHYPNYWLGKHEAQKQSEFAAKTYYFNASQRFPSDFAIINYGNLDAEINPNKVQAIYEEKLRKTSSNEVLNNLGVLKLEKGLVQESIQYFEDASNVGDWNNAPQINKWKALKKLNLIDSASLEIDYSTGNAGVKSNILTTQGQASELLFDPANLDNSRILHRQAYLLNSAYIFSDDTLEHLIRDELEMSSDGSFNSRMRNALAIHVYEKGEVNKAFMMLDYLQANAPQYEKGKYLNALGKLALDQQAYLLALDFFEQALDEKHTLSVFGKIEALANLDRTDEIPPLLLGRLKRNPELTDQANTVLERLDQFESKKIVENEVADLQELKGEEELLNLGSKNAFNESQLLAVVDELSERELSGGYELLVQAIEINPYSTALLKKYILVALDWNLEAYAEQSLTKLVELESSENLGEFLEIYEERKKQLSQDTW